VPSWRSSDLQGEGRSGAWWPASGKRAMGIFIGEEIVLVRAPLFFRAMEATIYRACDR
jgi:hypothetical protein